MAATPKKKKSSKKTPKKRGNAHIEKVGSPILRKNIMEEFPSLDDDAKREEFVNSEAWLAYCNKAYMVFRMMHRSGEAVAIAANQLNFPFPAFIWKPADKFEIVLCPIVEYTGSEWVPGMEGCLSVPGENLEVHRMDLVVLRGYDRHGGVLPERYLGGLHSRIVQHECDHLYGGLIIDYSDDKEGILFDLRKKRGFI